MYHLWYVHIGIAICSTFMYMWYSQYPLNLAAIFAGCGTGNYLVAMSNFVGKVTGVEVNEGMLMQAKKKTTHLANVDVHHGNILSLSFPDQQFDSVLCNQVAITIQFS